MHGSTLNNNNYEGGYYADVAANFFTITLLGDVDNPFIQLTSATAIPAQQNINVTHGTEWVNQNFFRSATGVITLVP
jgi:hypothetical protein